MLLAFIWMLLGRTGASAVSGEKESFSCPFPPLYQLNLGVIMENSKVTASCLNQWYVQRFAPMHQRPNSLSMMWERSLMTDFLMSRA